MQDKEGWKSGTVSGAVSPVTGEIDLKQHVLPFFGKLASGVRCSFKLTLLMGTSTERETSSSPFSRVAKTDMRSASGDRDSDDKSVREWRNGTPTGGRSRSRGHVFVFLRQRSEYPPL
jgi:hypothetical protein